jgi:hypothetical protein
LMTAVQPPDCATSSLVTDGIVAQAAGSALVYLGVQCLSDMVKYGQVHVV